MNIKLTLAASAVCMVSLTGIAAFVLARDSHNRRIALRLIERVAPLAQARAPKRPFFEQAGLPAVLETWQVQIAKLCGYRRDRSDAYPLRIPIFLSIAAVLALVIDRVAGRVLGFPLDFMLPVIWLSVCQALFRTLHGRYADKLYRQFPDVLSMIVRSVRAGVPLHEALRVVARESLDPTAAQFTRVVDQMAIGIRLEEALRDASSRTGVAEYAFFTVALTLQAQTGGSLAETLDNLADVIRKRVALRLRATALASEARTSAYILSGLPVVTGLALSVLNYDYIRPLFETQSGNRLLFSAIFLLCIAGTVMRLLIKRSLQ